MARLTLRHLALQHLGSGAGLAQAVQHFGAQESSNRGAPWVVGRVEPGGAGWSPVVGFHMSPFAHVQTCAEGSKACWRW